MKKMRTLILSAIVLINTMLVGLALPTQAFAQLSNNNIGVDCTTLHGNGINAPCSADIGKLIGTVVTIIFIAAALIALFFLIFGGIKWMLSGGSKEGTEGARKMITAAIIGLAIVFLSFVAIKILGAIFGFDISNLHIPSFSDALK